MKKSVMLLSVSIALLLVFSLTATATEIDIQDEINGELFSAIDGEIADELEKIGIEDLDFESIYNISFENVFEYFKSCFSNKLTGNISLFTKLLTVILFLSAIKIILKDDANLSFLDFIGGAVIVIITVENINSLLSSSISVLKMCNTFMIAFVPIFAAVIALSGHASSALTYSSVVLTIGEIISYIINYVLVDAIGCFLCVGIGFSVNKDMNTGRLIAFVNRIVNFILGISSSLFSSVLTIKGILSYSVDTVSSRGAKFLLSSLIPVVGASISQAYSSLVGSINIIKGSVAVVGIIAVAVINAPILAENLLLYLVLNLLSFICELTDFASLTSLFKVFACAVKILLLVTVFEMFVLIISTGVMLSLKGG